MSTQHETKQLCEQYMFNDSVLFWNAETMPHLKQWDEKAWDADLDKEMLQSDRTAADAAKRFDHRIFRDDNGNLVTKDLEEAHEYSRWTEHSPIYCIAEGVTYKQGDAEWVGAEAEPTEENMTSDLMKLYKMAASAHLAT